MSNKPRFTVKQTLAVVSEPQMETNHRILQPILTDLIAFSLSVKQLHWNVIGPSFRSIHLQLDEVNLDATDAVAERGLRLAATTRWGRPRASVMLFKHVDDLMRDVRSDRVDILNESHRRADEARKFVGNLAGD